MKIVKIIYKRQWKGELKNMPSYYLYVDGLSHPIMIKPCFNADYRLLEAISTFGGFKNNDKQDKEVKK